MFPLQGAAAGKGISNGSYKGHRLFTCPDGCAFFLPVSHIRLRHWSRSNGLDSHERAREKDHHRSSNNEPINGHHNNDRHHQQQQPSRHISFQQHRPRSPPQPHAFAILPRKAESVPVTAEDQSNFRSSVSPPPFHVGQRVCFPLGDSVYGGAVHFCGPLPGRSSSGMYVGVLLVSTVCSFYVPLVASLSKYKNMGSSTF